MTETRRVPSLRRAAVLAATTVVLGGPAGGQGMRPPVPGPFPVMTGAIHIAPMPTPTRPSAAQHPQAAGRGSAASRPLFEPPAGAMRMPYWMQAPVAAAPGTTAPNPAQATQLAAPQATAPAPVQRPATGGAGQRQSATSGGIPGYGVQAPWWVQPAPGAPQGYATPPGYGTATGGGGVAPAPAGGWVQQPGRGYGAAPGWAAAPYPQQPGWGGWAQPVPGVSQ